MLQDVVVQELMVELDQDSLLKIYTDGACRGNPGQASSAFIFLKKNETEPFFTFSKYLGEATNNIAEYTAVLLALQKAKTITKGKVEVYSDSKLLVSQVNGVYKIKSVHLKLFLDKIFELVKSFQSVTFTHVLRSDEFITLSDNLCNEILDRLVV